MQTIEFVRVKLKGSKQQQEQSKAPSQPFLKHPPIKGLSLTVDALTQMTTSQKSIKIQALMILLIKH